MTWRQEQVEATRRTILTCFRQLSSRPGAGPVTVAEVARESGISPATIYRHFPNRDALVHGAAFEDMYTGVSADLDRWGIQETHDHLVALWGTLESNLAVTRAGTVSEAGREMRRMRFEAQRETLSASLVTAGLDAESDQVRHYRAVVMLLSSAHAFLDLHDRQGMGASEAAATVAWAIDVLARSLGVDTTEIWIKHPNEDEHQGGQSTWTPTRNGGH